MYIYSLYVDKLGHEHIQYIVVLMPELWVRTVSTLMSNDCNIVKTDEQ